ncbi:MAG: hypothetical protein ACYC4J_10435 [Gemmatimonadaceae bacterium]
MRITRTSTVAFAIGLALVAGSVAGAQATPDTTKRTPRRTQVRIPVSKEPVRDTAPTPAPAPAPPPVVEQPAPAPAPAPVAVAPDTINYRSRYELGLLPTVEVSSLASRAAPGIAIGTPTGYGANWGDGFVGAGYQNRVRFTDNVDDGAVVAGIGFGNARDNLGLEIAATSVSTVRRGFGKDGTISAKVHRVMPRNWGIAVGAENLVNWGNTDPGDPSIYAALSKVIHLRNQDGDPFSAFTFNVGAGNGRFQQWSDFAAGKNGIYPFASAAIRILRPVSVIGDWSSGELAAGLSIAPFRWVPLVITPAIVDITNKANDTYGGRRFSIGVGLGFRWNGIRNIFLPAR